MLRAIRITALAGIVSAIAIIGLMFATSKEEDMLAALYEIAFGSPDLGPFDFEKGRRTAKPNTALACPPGFCANAVADFDPGIYPVSDEELRQRFTQFVLSEPHVAPVYRHESPGLPTQDRYVQRTRLMRFPDTIDVRFIPLTETTSTLAVYSRSQIGHSDMGVNLARLRRWTDGANLKAR
ncbi:MAG: DUF1499 domain-containing protein [Beijerinckiaceae bacterium]